MKSKQKSFLENIRELLLLSLVSLVQTFLTCANCNYPRQFLEVFLFTSLMWIGLWRGNSYLSTLISRKIRWIEYPVRRFVVGILVTISYTVVAVAALIGIFQFLSSISLGKGAWYTFYGSIVVTILISIFLHARKFLFFWRKESLERERFQKESAVARYESLRNQVNPHFLFNSLNALTNLVYEDQEKAVKFIKQLSEVYRYVLDTREREVVSLGEELKFLESYLFLQHIRFADRLRVKIDGLKETLQVAPLALQLLMENAIKHNIISNEQPLTIRMYQEEEFLVVENNLQKKTPVPDERISGMGLANICKRYEYLSNKKVQIINDGKTFTVKLPVLNGSDA
jgi:sensor histidine kinase YesM